MIENKALGNIMTKTGGRQRELHESPSSADKMIIIRQDKNRCSMHICLQNYRAILITGISYLLEEFIDVLA